MSGLTTPDHESSGTPTVGRRWWGRYFREVAARDAYELDELGVDTIDRFRRRYDDPAVEAAWRAVKGQRSGSSWHYLRILAGVQDVKAARMICAFVEQVLGRAVGPAEARELVVAAHERLLPGHPDLHLRTLDHAIWTHQRARTGSSRIR